MTIKKISNGFILLAILSLGGTLLFGLLGATQYVFPDFLKEAMPFNRIRPLHVTFAVGWILMGATGGVYYYLNKDIEGRLKSEKAALFHIALFAFSGVAAIISLVLGVFGGREYMAFYPLISFPILIGWILFAVFYFSNVFKLLKNGPVWLWMWGTGIIFFVFTFTEAHLWMIPWFRENLIRDLTVQWKAMGALVGSWNMLVYGTATYLAFQLTGSDKMARGKLPFMLYFLGLTNLILGWGHHTYIIPAEPWIRGVAYTVSMSEWMILAKLIWDVKKTLSAKGLLEHSRVFKFLFATDIWVALNLFLALLMSIPVINMYTHGTHITVAHSMGTTVGINTSILLASLFFIRSRENKSASEPVTGSFKTGFRLFHYGLVVFWAGLIIAGITKGIWMSEHGNDGFREMQALVLEKWKVILMAGIVTVSGILVLIIPVFRQFIEDRKRL